jgi:transcriptional regulator with XRE-family HTH domain
MPKSLHSSQYQTLLGLLKQARADQAVTQEELSARIGMTQSDISKVERGVRRLDVLELRTWLQGLEISLTSFVGELDTRLAASESLARQSSGRKRQTGR